MFCTLCDLPEFKNALKVPETTTDLYVIEYSNVKSSTLFIIVKVFTKETDIRFYSN